MSLETFRYWLRGRFSRLDPPGPLSTALPTEPISAPSMLNDFGVTGTEALNGATAAARIIRDATADHQRSHDRGFWFVPGVANPLAPTLSELTAGGVDLSPYLARPDVAPPVSTDEVLSRIDAAVDGLCPCGAPPRDGSIYCSPDCEPTHISRDTDRRESGAYATPMRWRPDLVSAAPDDHLIPLGSQTFYVGRHHAQLFERTDRPNTWHLRLDDGNRFVGCDLDAIGDINDELVQRLGEAWARLESELGNTRHLVPDDDPWADAMPELRRLWDEMERGMLDDIRASERNTSGWRQARASFMASERFAAQAMNPNSVFRVTGA